MIGGQKSGSVRIVISHTLRQLYVSRRLTGNCIFNNGQSLLSIVRRDGEDLPLGTRGNLATEAACRRFGSLTGFDD